MHKYNSETIEKLKIAADRGETDAQLALGNFYYTDIQETNLIDLKPLIENTYKYYVLAATQHNVEAQKKLGEFCL